MGDHGKTALLKALTGIDTDRLNEEKRRSMSIVLRFSYLEPDSGMVDLIDVRGHAGFRANHGVASGHSPPLKTAAVLRLLFGTREAVARVRLLVHRAMLPGSGALVQLRIAEVAAIYPGEPFIVRAMSPVPTLAGGRILAMSAAIE